MQNIMQMDPTEDQSNTPVVETTVEEAFEITLLGHPQKKSYTPTALWWSIYLQPGISALVHSESCRKLEGCDLSSLDQQNFKILFHPQTTKVDRKTLARVLASATR